MRNEPMTEEEVRLRWLSVPPLALVAELRLSRRIVELVAALLAVTLLLVLV